MRCLCPHYQETDGGWCCLETLRQRDENAELKEALARANAEIKRLRAERTKAPLEGVFEEGTPSSQRLKETSPEERVARRGGARPGRKYQEIFLNNEESLFRWVEDPAVPAENNAAERAVRPLAMARKVSHGSQGEGGLRTREVLGSVLLTLRLRHGRDAWKVHVGALDKLAADPKTDIVRELFPEYDPDKEDSAKAARA